MKSYFCFLFSLAIIFSSFFQSAYAWTVSPVRFEIKGEKGKEYTLSFTVLNESQLFQKRFKVVADDWILDDRSNFVVRSISKEPITNNYSATSWVKVTPTQFVIPPGASRKVRFTVTIPQDLPSDGTYCTGIFVGEENIEKPPKGKKVVNIQQHTFIGVVAYITIGQEKESVTLTNITGEAQPVGSGLSSVAVLPFFENTGNVHSRGLLKLKLTPTTPLKPMKIKSPDGKKEEDYDPETIQKEILVEDVVILRESKLAYPITIPQFIPQGSEWDFELKADFGKKVPLLVGKKHFKVPIITPSPEPEKPSPKSSPIPSKKT